MNIPKKAIIAGAGPAGLTAAYELLMRTDIKPVILEKTSDIGGIAKTVNYKGNRMDIGGHRFFSKSDRVMNWWLNILPLENPGSEPLFIQYQHKFKQVDTSNLNLSVDKSEDKVMLIRNRLSRIYYLKKFFSYPVQLSADTIKKLGLLRLIKIGSSYLAAKINPIKKERSLEEFFINRFGKELYETFFKDYTEKVWGVSCRQIPPEWGAQRIKELSVGKAIRHAFNKKFSLKKDKSVYQKGTETSLIEKFLYPKYGVGQMWEEVARIITEKGGEIYFNQSVTAFETDGNKVKKITSINSQTDKSVSFEGDYFFSTMPVKELISGLRAEVPDNIKKIAEGLQYRDFITVGLLIKQSVSSDTKINQLKDNWIYIQESNVKLGRLQLFNNWSPFMVKDPGTVWLGLEYFCNKGDALWNLTDDAFIQFAIDELVSTGLINKEDVSDGNIVRMEKTYPAYFGTYDQFSQVKTFIDKFENLFLIGRNGMHKYNNSDHSMLTAMTAVDNIIKGILTKDNIWEINTEQDYHEKKQ